MCPIGHRADRNGTTGPLTGMPRAIAVGCGGGRAGDQTNESRSNMTTALGAVLALAAVATITWRVSRARADRRWRAAQDRYADQEEVKAVKG